MKMLLRRSSQGITAILLVLLVVVSISGQVLAAPTREQASGKQGTASCIPDPRENHVSDAVAIARITKLYGATRIAGKKRWERGCLDPNAAPLTSYVSQYSGSWSGYISDVEPTPYVADGVYGEFNISTYTGLQPVLSSWVGVGGYYGNGHLIQAGYTTTKFGYTGKRTFYELFPAGPVTLWDVKGYFTNYEYVTIDFDSTTGQWWIYIDDTADPNYFYDPFTFDPDKNTAEWIEERAPSTIGAVPSTIDPQQMVGVYWIDDYGRQEDSDSSEVATVRRVLMKDSPNGTYECLVPTGITDSSMTSTFIIKYQSSC